VDLTLKSLTEVLRSRFPDRKQAEAEVVESLLADLVAFKITTVDELEQMLDANADAFLAHEREFPPNNEPGARFAAAGVVRTSLSIAVPDFMDSKVAGTVGLDEPEIAPLGPGEERLLQVIHRLDGNRNDIFLVHRDASDYQMTGPNDPNLFAAIIRHTDEDPDKSTLPLAWQVGATERSIYIRLAEALSNSPPLPGVKVELDSGVEWYVERIREKYGPEPTPMETAGILVTRYVELCEEVMAGANACLEVANRIIVSGGAAANSPGQAGSIRDFMAPSESDEQRLARLFRGFDGACTAAKELAAEIVSNDSMQAEIVLMTNFPQDVLDRVATAKGVLGATYGPTAVEYLQGVEAANELMRNPTSDGNIYGSSLLRPPPKNDPA
jgi:hypothetical protein